MKVEPDLEEDDDDDPVSCSQIVYDCYAKERKTRVSLECFTTSFFLNKPLHCSANPQTWIGLKWFLP